jgi:hypothetical protein
MMVRVTVTGWVLRVLVAVGPLVALLAGVPQGYPPSVFMVVVVTVGGVLFALVPEHFVGAGVMGVVVLWWAAAVGEGIPVASLVAAAALLTSHVAATLLALGPARVVLDRAVVLRWAVRSLLVWPAALVVWLVADAFSGRPTPTTFWLAGLAAALVAAVAAGLVLPARSDDR